MADLGGFDASKYEPQGFDVLPAGEYECVLVASQKKPAKSGPDRFYLELEFQVLNGPCQNRKFWDRLNLWNPNETAVTIAKGMLSALCRAVGVLTPKDSAELHGKPLRAKLKVKKSDEFGESNEVTAYKPRNGAPGEPTEDAGPEDVGGAKSPW